MPIVLHNGDPRKGVAFIATPCSGNVTPQYAYGLFTAGKKLAELGIDSHLEIYAENCHVDDGRNRLVRDFLETSCTELIFIDSDLRFEPADLVKLIECDEDVVAGIYPLKQVDESYPVRHLPGDIIINEKGLIEVESVPTGFLKIKRHVLEELAKDSNVFPCKDDPKGKRMVPIIFERTFVNNCRWGGDYTFCLKWRNKGGKIYINPNFRLEHYGVKCWSGTYLQHIKRKMGEGLKPLLDQIKNGTERIQTILDLVEQYGNSTFAASPEFLAETMLGARKADGAILECGTGLTTLVMACATKQKIYSLEHNPIWATHIQKELERYDITNVELIFAPLKDKWYQTPENLPNFSMVVLDGPPRNIGDRTKLQLLDKNINVGATILMDDAEMVEEISKDFQIKGVCRPYAIMTKKEMQ